MSTFHRSNSLINNNKFKLTEFFKKTNQQIITENPQLLDAFHEIGIT